MKTRELACINYICEGQCKLGKDATFYGHCQICPSYSKLPGGKPAREDTRKARREREDKKNFQRERGNY